MQLALTLGHHSNIIDGPEATGGGGDYIEDGEYNDDRGQQRDNGAFGGSSSSSSFRDVSVSSVSYRAKTSNEATAGAFSALLTAIFRMEVIMKSL